MSRGDRWEVFGYCCLVTVLEVIKRSAEFLSRKGIDSPRLQVELLLAHALKMPRLQLYLNFERVLTAPELEAVREMVRRRSAHEPLQHIVGSASFCGFEIAVSPAVLIPRVETELLAEAAWEFLNTPLATRVGSATALDMGTGSGCIAIAMAAKVPEARIWAVDVSAAALAIARGNAQRNAVADRIEFVCTGSLESLTQPQRFDLIVSNPPYIPTLEMATLAPEVRDFDPRLALDGGADGLDFFRRLAEAGLGRLESHGRIMVEFGEGQAAPLGTIFEAAGWDVESVRNDLTGRPRILIARKAQG